MDEESYQSVPVSFYISDNRGDSFVPKGFESTAHPCFFKSKPVLELKPSKAFEEKMGDFCRKHTTEKKHSGTSNGRQVDTICPICLGPFSKAVTITTCLHTFCHHCLVSWLAHLRIANEKIYSDLNIQLGCPLCKDICRYFLHVDFDLLNQEKSLATGPFQLYAVNDVNNELCLTQSTSRKRHRTERECSLPNMEQLRSALSIQRKIHVIVQSSMPDSVIRSSTSESDCKINFKPETIIKQPLWTPGVKSSKEVLNDIEEQIQIEQSKLNQLDASMDK